jgi:hypothetical protein
MPRRCAEVIPRLACPSWRCMTSSGIPSRDISTAVRVPELVWREPAANSRASAVRCNWRRMVAGAHGRPRVGPRSTQKERADGQVLRSSSQRSSCSPRPAVHPELPLAPLLTRTDQDGGRAGRQIGRCQRERLTDPQPERSGGIADARRRNTPKPVTNATRLLSRK